MSLYPNPVNERLYKIGLNLKETLFMYLLHREYFFGLRADRMLPDYKCHFPLGQKSPDSNFPFVCMRTEEFKWVTVFGLEDSPDMPRIVHTVSIPDIG